MYAKRKVRIDPADRAREEMTKPELWSVCAASGCDPRTVLKIWRGELSQEGSAIRVWSAFKSAGLLKPEAKRPFIPVAPQEEEEDAKKDLPASQPGA